MHEHNLDFCEFPETIFGIPIDTYTRLTYSVVRNSREADKQY